MFPVFFKGLFFGRHGLVFIIVVILLTIFPLGPFQRVSRLWNFNAQSPGNGYAVIEFKNEPPFVKREVLTIDSETAYFFNVKVSNKSDKTLNVIEWKLVNLQRKEGRKFNPWGEIYWATLEWDARQYIAQKDHIFVSFAHIFSSVTQAKRETQLGFWNSGYPNFRFNIKPWHAAMTSHLEPGTYRFKLIVSFDNAPPAEAEFELIWKGNREDTLEKMAKEIKIRKL